MAEFGYIKDSSGKILTDLYVSTVNMNTGEVYYSPEYWPTGEYRFSSYPDDPEVAIKIERKGFKPAVRSILELVQFDYPTIYMQRDNTLLLVAAITAGVILLPGNNSIGNPAAAAAILKDVRLPKPENKQIANAMWILFAAGVAFSTYKIFIMLGLIKDKDEVDLDRAVTDPDSWWNPAFYLTKPASIPYTRPISTAQAVTMADAIYDAMGWFDDTEEAVKGVFRQLPSQAAGSFLCAVFLQRYNADLLDFLRGGNWPYDRLSDADVNEINQFVNRLPKY